ncbi:MAG: flippase-like domain-containing protein, partial [Gemmatimonadetes bacterium]|nr:flippase-like domain-containing protein [Gemmatimonadota bacterium]
MKKWLPYLRFVISALLIWFLYRRVPLGDLGEILTSLRWDLFALVYALTFFNTVLSAMKWQSFLRAADLHVPLRSLVGTYLTGSFFNLFLPSSVGGDVYRVFEIKRSTGRGADSLASVFADRLSGLLALVILGMVFSLAGFRFLPDPRVIAIPAGFCAAI